MYISRISQNHWDKLARVLGLAALFQFSRLQFAGGCEEIISSSLKFLQTMKFLKIKIGCSS